MKKTLLIGTAICSLLALASCANKQNTEVNDSVAKIEVDSTTIIVTEDTVVKTDTVKVTEQPSATSDSLN
ncbi:MAG: hypothetical protein NC201_05875 [Prevotella sp.]|nr:hypothetical protein [Bacteroides sp.]MCM1366762.1 hypothetical protein [Prevotella sp.]MCM1437381.1 hypothetical protein [Prevotella sp.]